MIALLQSLGGWGWVMLGLVLIGLEMLAPGLFLIWLGLAALVTGLIDLGLGLSWQAAGLTFAFLCVASVLMGRRLMRRDSDLRLPSDDLNIRGHRLIGQSFKLDRPLTGGEGQLKIGDSVWRITGPDMVAGAMVRVTALDGATLKVEAA